MPLLAIALMVKDEATSILSVLSSFLDGGIRHFFVLDTGSTDNTVELTQAFFQQHDLTSSCLKQEAFIDFATSRNRTLALAEQHFPQAVFFLMPDAEWYLHHPETLLTFCEQQKNAATPLYLMKIKMNAVDFYTARLFRAASKIRFKGVVHEVPDTLASIKVADPVHFQVKPTQQGVEKSRQRWRRDLTLLAKAHAASPDDPRTAFYLAQTHDCLGELEPAYAMYLHRAQLLGWDEENFITWLRLGNLAERLSAKNATFTWAIAMEHFLKAFSVRPHRIEPLIQIAEHYWPANIQTCYLFSRYAYSIPYPHNDILFIDKVMYHYTRYEIMSRCAWYMGEYALGEEATLLALEEQPDRPHLHNNLRLYQEKLATGSAVVA